MEPNSDQSTHTHTHSHRFKESEIMERKGREEKTERVDVPHTHMVARLMGES